MTEPMTGHSTGLSTGHSIGPGLVLADEQIIAGVLEQMRHLQHQIWLLHRYAEDHVACPTGFTGVFGALRPALGELASATQVVANRFSSAYGEVIETLDASARSLRSCDESVDADFARVARWAEAP